MGLITIRIYQAQARLTCNDGRVDVSNATCNYVTGLVYSNWSNWSPVSPKQTRNCTAWYPDPSTVNAGQTYTGTRTCDVYYKRTRTVSKQWNDGRANTYLRTETGNQWIASTSDEGSVTGTKPRVIVSQGWGNWSNWSSWSYGSISCSSANLFPGVDKQTCTRPKSRTQTRQYIYTYSMAPITVYGSTQTNTSTGTDTISNKCHPTGNSAGNIPCKPIGFTWSAPEILIHQIFRVDGANTCIPMLKDMDFVLGSMSKDPDFQDAGLIVNMFYEEFYGNKKSGSCSVEGEKNFFIEDNSDELEVIDRCGSDANYERTSYRQVCGG